MTQEQIYKNLKELANSHTRIFKPSIMFRIKIKISKIKKWLFPKTSNYLTYMLNCIEDKLNYEGCTRQILSTRILKQGEICFFPKEEIKTSLSISEDGKTIELVQKGTKLFPAEYWIDCAIDKILNKDSMNKIYKTISIQEDLNTFKLLYHAAKDSNNIISIESLDKVCIDKFKNIAKNNGFDIEKLVINRAQLDDIKKSFLIEDFTPVLTSAELLTGVFGSLENINIFVISDLGVTIPEGMIIGLAAPEKLGSITTRIKPTIIDATSTTKKYIIGEFINQCIFDTSNVIIGIKPNCIIPEWLEK